MKLTAFDLKDKILVILKDHLGSWEVSATAWMNAISEKVGSQNWSQDWSDVQSALLTLRDEGIIELSKRLPDGNFWYWRSVAQMPTDPPTDPRQFFQYNYFIVSITDAGRQVWDVSTGKIGFRQTA